MAVSEDNGLYGFIRQTGQLVLQACGSGVGIQSIDQNQGRIPFHDNTIAVPPADRDPDAVGDSDHLFRKRGIIEFF